MRWRLVLATLRVVAITSTLMVSPAHAHKLKVFASAEGAVVSGYAYFSGGARVRDSQLRVTLPDDRPIFTGTTDDTGAFRFEARVRADHRIVVDGGDGHQAWFTLVAADLPPTLPPLSSSAITPSPPPIPTPPLLPPTAALPATELAAPTELAAVIERAVARQIRPLREDLDAYEERVRWHDVVGGIGTLIGLSGLAYGLAMRRRSKPESG